MVPGRKNPLFTEDGILAAIDGTFAAIEAGQRPVIVERPQYQSPRTRGKYRGFMALYAHYLYILGKIEKREYPPRMTPRLRANIMRFEQLRAQFAFLRENNIATANDMGIFTAKTEENIAALTKRRTILNVRKKKRRTLYAALADVQALALARACYENGLTGLADEYARCMEAEAVLTNCGIERKQLREEKAALYEELAEINRKLRAERKKLKMCEDITKGLPQIERDIDRIDGDKKKKVEKSRWR